MNFTQNVLQDVYLYHNLLFTGRQPSFFSLVYVVLSSRGLFVVTVQKISHLNFNLHPSKFSEKLFKIAIKIFLKISVYLSCVLAKCQFLVTTATEAGVYLSNRGHIILGARSIGTGTVIHHCVTIGKNNIGDSGLPEIGRNVWIGPDSVIYGNIKIGDGVTVLPGSVITKSVPSGAVVQGNPARVIRRLYDNSVLRSNLSADVSQVIGETG